MTSEFGMTSGSQNVRNDNAEALLNWLEEVFTDLRCRADALRRLVDSHHYWRIHPAGSTAESDDEPVMVTVRVDRDAWLCAMDAAHRPAPAFPAVAPPQR